MIIKWHPCPGHPNYEINRLAQIRSMKTGKLLKPYDDGSGYLRVKLDGENCRLHILVALAFIPNPENKPVVNHKHGKSMIAELPNWNGQPFQRTQNTLGIMD